jgi:Transposase DNA-binding/Transposase Tn5 dimerisation domain
MSVSWALDESLGADLGDARLNQRMAVLLGQLGERPNLSIPAACGGRAEMEAAYRFFDNEKVSLESVLASHIQRTRQRMAEQKRVILVQDSTEIDLTRPQSQVNGVGLLDGARRGLLLHVMHGFTPDGTPLGTVWAKSLNRANRAASVRHRKQRPIEHKESLRWLEGLRAARELAAQLPEVHCLCVTDSEGDIYELLAEPRQSAGSGASVDWLIRGCYDRRLSGDEPRGVLEEVLKTPLLYETEIRVRARRPKIKVGCKKRRKRNQPRTSRRAKVQVRAASLMLAPPRRPDSSLPPVSVQVVLVREIDPPTGETPIEWLLLTSLSTETMEQVRAVVQYYCLRWNIEILFRTLKGGCRIEQRRFEEVQRVLSAIGLYLIVAWRTLLTVRLGREHPDVSCELLLEPSEWKAVWATTKREKPPQNPPGMRQIVHLIAQLGGYIERKNNEPGPQTIWIGIQRMHDLALAWDCFGPDARGAR